MKCHLLFATLMMAGCTSDTQSPATNPAFGNPQRVSIVGYDGNAMEPFLSRDGNVLFFNNLNSAPENTNLHWSSRVDDSTFHYQGELNGVNTSALEGVATLDRTGAIYFVSDRDYTQTLATIYAGTYASGEVSNITHVDNLSKNVAGWLNFDVEVSADGNYLYFVDGRFDQNGGPYDADFAIAQKDAGGFHRMANSSEILKNINSSALEYAAGISADGLELYFTRVDIPLTATSLTSIYVATRSDQNSPFGIPSRLSSLDGFVEAPTLSPNGKLIYFHKRVNGKFDVYLARKI